MTPGQRAEGRIAELGIRDPQDLDIEAIACDAGVDIRYETLSGCEATLVGYRDHAIATIRPSRIEGRERFSIGHEVGHWEMHRGQSFYCRVDNPSDNLASDVSLEKEADEFASHLLMPSMLFTPIVKTWKWPSLTNINDVARLFHASTLATTIRLAKVDMLPVIIACYTLQGRRWHIAAPHVPKRWWLKGTLDPDTFAYDLLIKGSSCEIPRKQSADAWFENGDADEFEVLEQCYSPVAGEALVVLYLTEGEMFDRGFDPNVRKRR